MTDDEINNLSPQADGQNKNLIQIRQTTSDIFLEFKKCFVLALRDDEVKSCVELLRKQNIEFILVTNKSADYADAAAEYAATLPQYLTDLKNLQSSPEEAIEILDELRSLAVQHSNKALELKERYANIQIGLVQINDRLGKRGHSIEFEEDERTRQKIRESQFRYGNISIAVLGSLLLVTGVALTIVTAGVSAPLSAPMAAGGFAGVVGCSVKSEQQKRAIEDLEREISRLSVSRQHVVLMTGFVDFAKKSMTVHHNFWASQVQTLDSVLQKYDKMRGKNGQVRFNTIRLNALCKDWGSLEVKYREYAFQMRKLTGSSH
ncbi:hypothetical protein BC938DRAFT_481302 [Jimgerdemannia flammicorona]|uniref:Uncharacterized protein n=1 Tax=Jimgerdemannia flammicorona TaxID=994334 RepID=A0A433QGE6_9FUNG|nr:hypothetical protein BC938DRAFT_481302 [Jimgerdemannia flammicorona]